MPALPGAIEDLRIAPDGRFELKVVGGGNPEGICGSGLVDAVEHRQDFEAVLKAKYGKDVVFDKKYGKKQAAKVNLSSPLAVFKALGDMIGEGKVKPTGKGAVAVVYKANRGAADRVVP